MSFDMDVLTRIRNDYADAFGEALALPVSAIKRIWDDSAYGDPLETLHEAQGFDKWKTMNDLTQLRRSEGYYDWEEEPNRFIQAETLERIRDAKPSSYVGKAGGAYILARLARRRPAGEDSVRDAFGTYQHADPVGEALLNPIETEIVDRAWNDYTMSRDDWGFWAC